MSKQVRFRRGTTVQHSSFTGVAGEVTIDTTKNVPVVHNGTTAGGIPLLREDRPRGYTKMEIFTTTGTTYTIANKTDLKRIRVTVFGGGGGGGSYCGGGAGGYGFRVMELNELTTNTAVTIGAGGAATAAGGSTTFGAYITATGGSGATNGADSAGAGGTVTGTNTVNLGAQAGRNHTASSHPTYGAFPNYGASGGGFGGGRPSTTAQGIRGGGGGSGAAGAQGCVIVEEIYGYV